MSPLYRFGCCDKEIEVIQGIDKENPLCSECGIPMQKLLTSPAIITIRGKDGIRSYPRGYKEDYAKDYRRRLQDRQEAKVLSSP